MDFQRLCRPAGLFSRHGKDALSEGNLISGFRPFRVFLQPEGNRHGVFPGHGLLPEGQRIGLFRKRRHVRFHGPAVHRLPVPLQQHVAPVCRGGGEHVPVDHRHLLRVRLHHDILVAVFHFLQLRRFLPVGKNNAVAAEDPVVRPVAPVPAVQQGFLSVPVPGCHRLINEVPDKSALVQFLLIRQLRIFVHGAVGVAHGMRVFAKDERLLPVFLQVCPHPVRGRVHLRFDVRNLPDPQFREAHVVHLVVPFIVDRPRRIQFFHFPAHGQDHRARQAFIAAAPDQDARMVPVPSHHGPDPVQQQRFPVLPVPGEHFLFSDAPVPQHVPHAVAFHVVFVNHIQAQLVAEAVQGAVVGIVAGPHCVDVVPFHQDQVPPDLLLRHGPAGFPAEVMPVGSLEDHPDPVHPDHAVHDFNLPEACPERDDLLRAGRCPQAKLQVIQVRILRGPQPGILRRQHAGNLRISGNRLFLFRNSPAPVRQPDRQDRSFRRADPGLPLQHALLHRFIGFRQRLDVPYVRFRHSIQVHVPVQAGKAQEVLVLQPAAGTEAVHPARQFVFPVLQRLRQFKLVGRKAV